MSFVSRAALGVFLGGVLLFSGSAVLAACPTGPSTSPLLVGEVGLFFDVAGTVSCSDVGLFQSTPLYLVGRAPEGGFAEYILPELRESSEAVVVTSGPALTGDSVYVLAGVADDCSYAFRPISGQCPTAAGEIVVLAQYAVMRLGTGEVCFSTRCPTFAGNADRTPSYVTCDDPERQEFTLGDHLCPAFGSTTVSTGTTSFGVVKGSYRSP